MAVRPLSDVQPRELAWLWRERLGLGALALLDGDPDLGKTFLALDLCARLSTNRPMPDGSACPGPANSLYLFLEDGLASAIQPRAARLGADLQRVFFEDFADGLWLFPRDLARLKEALGDTQARLVVIDPIMAFLDPSINSASDQSLRRMLTPLKFLAEAHQCVILLIRHLNKAAGMRAIYRGGGSIAFSAACRSEWLVARIPQAGGRCVLAQQKNNHAPYQPSLAYELRPDRDDKAELFWHGQTEWTATQVLSRHRPKLDTRLEEAIAFLQGFLPGNPKNSREVWVAAEERGIREKTIRRAYKRMPLRFVQRTQGNDQLTYWLLPGQEPPPRDPSTDLWPFFQEQLKRLSPASSPLDDVA